MRFYCLYIKINVNTKSWQRPATLTCGYQKQKFEKSLRKTVQHYLVQLSIFIHYYQIFTRSQTLQKNYFIYVQETCKIMLTAILFICARKKALKNRKKHKLLHLYSGIGVITLLRSGTLFTLSAQLYRKFFIFKIMVSTYNSLQGKLYENYKSPHS